MNHEKINKPKKILILCWGNIMRSPTAKFILDREISNLGLDQEYVCESRGIQGSGSIPSPKFSSFNQYKEEFKLAKPVMDRYRIDISHHTAKPIDHETIYQADLILAMDDRVLLGPEGGLLLQFPEAKTKTRLLSELVDKKHDIQDPAEITNENKYEQVLKLINLSIQEGLPTLLKLTTLYHETRNEINQETHRKHPEH